MFPSNFLFAEKSADHSVPQLCKVSEQWAKEKQHSARRIPSNRQTVSFPLPPRIQGKGRKGNMPGKKRKTTFPGKWFLYGIYLAIFCRIFN
jgi:hypothetical protein